MTPQRIQRQRTKGWKKPEGCINVTRPGKWGNPFRDIQDMVYIKGLNKFASPWIYLCMNTPDKDALSMFHECVLNNSMVYAYCQNLDPVSQGHWFMYFENISKSLHELRGHNLMCFCPIGAHCHGDVLLKLANK